MAEPPLLVGADHDTTALVFPAVAVTVAGGPATVAGVTATDAGDGGEPPTAFVATTRNVYGVPLVSPDTVAVVVVAPVVVAVRPPGDDVTV
jgi:hypothetical protein